MKALICSEPLKCGDQINAVVLDGLRRRRPVAEGAVRPDGVVVTANVFSGSYANVCSKSSHRAVSTKSKPARAITFAKAAPIPDDAPVIRATRLEPSFLVTSSVPDMRLLKV